MLQVHPPDYRAGCVRYERWTGIIDFLVTGSPGNFPLNNVLAVRLPGAEQIDHDPIRADFYMQQSGGPPISQVPTSLGRRDKRPSDGFPPAHPSVLPRAAPPGSCGENLALSSKKPDLADIAGAPSHGPSRSATQADDHSDLLERELPSPSNVTRQRRTAHERFDATDIAKFKKKAREMLDTPKYQEQIINMDRARQMVEDPNFMEGWSEKYYWENKKEKGTGRILIDHKTGKPAQRKRPEWYAPEGSEVKSSYKGSTAFSALPPAILALFNHGQDPNGVLEAEEDGGMDVEEDNDEEGEETE